MAVKRRRFRNELSVIGEDAGLLIMGFIKLARTSSFSIANRHFSGRSIRQMHISYIPMRWGSSDNYCYVVTDDATKESAVIDPAFPNEVLPELRKQINSHEIKLTSIVNTHHHYDHSGGNQDLHKEFSSLPIYAGANSPLVTKVLKEGQSFLVGESIKFTAYHTPCHTQDSICWFVTDSKTDQRALFSGDTLFNCGCGRFFEGTPKEMVEAMKKLSSLPKDTVVYPGHEYTKSNVRFAVQVEPENARLRALEKFCAENEITTGKFTLEDEREYNPFMRTSEPSVQKKVGCPGNEEQTMAVLRLAKDTGRTI